MTIDYTCRERTFRVRLSAKLISLVHLLAIAVMRLGGFQSLNLKHEVNEDPEATLAVYTTDY